MSDLLFKRSKYASWEVRKHNIVGGDEDVFAYHCRCNISKIMYPRSSYSKCWYPRVGCDVDVNPECFACKCVVPDYIQALVLLHAP